MTSFYSREELEELGFRHLGKNVSISKKASVYGAENMEIEDNARIDDFCILSGEIKIGRYVHISAYSALFGGNTGIILEDFAGLSSRGVIYAESDDYSGEALTNPTVPDKYRNVICGKVIFHKHVLVGTGCCILPGVEIGEGSAVGSMSLVNKSLPEWGIFAGIPCKKIKERNKKILDWERNLLAQQDISEGEN